MAIRNKTTNLYTEWKPLIISLGDEDAGKVFKSIFNYQSGEDVFYSNPVWEFIKSKIDEYNTKGLQISEKRRENGKLGGLAKASKCQQMLANPSKSSNKIKENKIKEKMYIKEFNDFWSVFPKDRAGNKEKAYKSYCKAIEEGRSSPEKILEATKIYSKSEEVKKGYAKGCAAWLNDDRFNNQFNSDVKEKSPTLWTDEDFERSIYEGRR